MDASTRYALPAVVRRHRGRARLRTATLAIGAAGLVAAGAVAANLPGTVTKASTGTQVVSAPAANGTTSVVHVTSGGSGVATTTTTAGTAGASAPTVAAGASHATSGGS